MQEKTSNIASVMQFTNKQLQGDSCFQLEIIHKSQTFDRLLLTVSVFVQYEVYVNTKGPIKGEEVLPFLKAIK